MTSGKQTRNAVILFSVPQNTGDEALLEAMKQGLLRIAPDITFSLSVKNIDSLPQGVHDFEIFYDPDQAIFYDNNTLKTYWLQHIRKIFSGLGILHHAVKHAWWTTTYSKKTMAAINGADMIILSGGSYLNDTYDARPKLAALIRIANRTTAPLILIGQSVGPFWRCSSIKLFGKALSKMSLISLRESLSLKWIPDQLRHRVLILPDLAFLHYKSREVMTLKKKPGSKLQIGLCFRSWENDHKYIEELGLTIVSHLLEHYDANIKFVSTCQGINGYVDDHKMSAQISGRLSVENQPETDLIHHSPESFMKVCQTFDAVISMRLHGCILAMVSGTPAFCIGYEDKSEGIYEMIGYEKHHIHYKQKPVDIVKSIDEFILAIPAITKELPMQMANMREKATMNFEQLKPFFRHE